MKRIFWLFAAFAGFLSGSCEKDKPDNETSTFSVKMNGTDQVFNWQPHARHYPLATFSTEKAIYYNLDGIDLQANTYNNRLVNEIYILVYADKPVTTGTYTDASGYLPYVMISYTDYSGASMENFISTDATVVIQSLSDTRISGTFSGHLTCRYGNGPSQMTMTDGMFNLAFKP